jgi:short-subunit dehydrogenase
MAQKSILITGCSSGIGLCAATLLKQRGYRVFATTRKAADVEKLRAQGFESMQLDITDPASIQQTLAQILALTNHTLDALFNNAGYMQAGAIADLSADIERAQFETNVFGPMELTRRVLPIMREQGHGRIIQNSSILGVLTMPYYGAYNASKFALEGFSRTLRQELQGTNIHVSLLNPGPIQSQLRAHAYEHYQNTIQSLPTSAHKLAYQKLEHSYFNAKRKRSGIAQPPEAVVKKLIHALESEHPHVHYYVGIPAQILAVLRCLLPDGILDWLLIKVQ